MTIKPFQQPILILMVSLAVSGARVQAGNQCSSGGVCSSSSREDLKNAADQQREASKIRSHGIYSSLMDKRNERRLSPLTDEIKEQADKNYTDHKAVVKKWVGAHHPEIEKGSADFDYQVDDEMLKDAPKGRDSLKMGR